MNNERTIKQMLDAAGPVSRLVPAPTAELIMGLASAVRQLTEQRDAVVAESVEIKSKGRELLNEACKVYEAFNASIDPESGDFIDGQTLHEFQFVLDTGSNSTSAILDTLRAEGVDMAISVVADCSNHICEGGEPESRQYEESIVTPHLDGIHDELTTIARQLRENKGAQL